MKKWLLIPFLMLFILLSGCGKNEGYTAEEAGTLLVDRLIFEKSNQEFTEQFVDGETLVKSFDENANDFRLSFMSSLENFGSVTDDEAVEMTRDLVKEMDRKTSYSISDVKINGDYARITFKVYGLDFSGMIEAAINDLLTDYKASPEIMSDEIFAGKRAISLLEDEINAIEAKKSPVSVALVLKKEGNHWTLGDNQEVQIEKIFMTFISGVKDSDELSVEVNDVVAKVVQELIEETATSSSSEEKSTGDSKAEQSSTTETSETSTSEN